MVSVDDVTNGAMTVFHYANRAFVTVRSIESTTQRWGVIAIVALFFSYDTGYWLPFGG